jgi:hypothetical protein
MTVLIILYDMKTVITLIEVKQKNAVCDCGGFFSLDVFLNNNFKRADGKFFHTCDKCKKGDGFDEVFPQWINEKL